METLNENKDYKVHPDDADVRGWDVMAEGVNLGTVDDMVLDTQRMAVKYLELTKLDKEEKTNYHYLIPLEQVNFNRHSRYVDLVGDSNNFLDAYPKFTNEIPADYDERVKNYYSSDYTREYPDKNSRIYEDEMNYESNISATGELKEVSVFGKEYEKIKKYPENWEEKIDTLEKQKQLKELRKLEMERDIALINEELIQIKTKFK